jgi:hypothetical protein
MCSSRNTLAFAEAPSADYFLPISPLNIWLTSGET